MSTIFTFIFNDDLKLRPHVAFNCTVSQQMEKVSSAENEKEH